MGSSIGGHAEELELLDRRVVREEIDHTPSREQFTLGEVEMGDPGGVGDRSKRAVSDARAGEVEMGYFAEAGEDRVEDDRREVQALVHRQAADG